MEYNNNLTIIDDFANSDDLICDYDIEYKDHKNTFYSHAFYYGNLGIDPKEEVKESTPFIQQGLKV